MESAAPAGDKVKFEGSRRGQAITARQAVRRSGACIALSSAAAVLSGCQVDSFIDPSITGRWEPTPTSLPILDRISVIEDDLGELVETTAVTPEDLISGAQEYRVAPGDRLLITLYDFESRQGGTELPRDVDLQGNIDLPQLGLVNVAGRTVAEAQAEIVRALSRFIIEPLVSIVPLAQRQQTYAVIGAVESPGPYFIPRPDYRLLEAITAAGRFPESIEEIYVIRQVALDDSVRAGVRPSGVDPAPLPATTPAKQSTPSTPPPKQPESLIDLIDDLTGGGSPGSDVPDGGKRPDPSEMEAFDDALTPEGDTPKGDPGSDPDGGSPASEPRRSMPSVLSVPIDLVGSVRGDPPASAGSGDRSSRAEPAIDLVSPSADQVARPATDPMRASSTSDPTWVFVNGEWVLVKSQRGAGAEGRGGAAGSQGVDDGVSAMVTQRVIRIPVKPLLAGDARYNIVVRQGDTVRVPVPTAGLVYMAGQVQRPGPYSLPDVGKLTLLRAVDSAGGLNAIAIPERCDVTRIVGKDRQATIRINLRAIAEQTEPDLYLKPDDRINVGTNFWALPLAVLRGGFRTNYGFGFVVDRNFGNDIFGAPPENRGF